MEELSTLVASQTSKRSALASSRRARVKHTCRDTAASLPFFLVGGGSGASFLGSERTGARSSVQPSTVEAVQPP